VTLPPELVPCTVGILTFNSRDVLRRALDATEPFAERIVCDGGSDDGTLELARERGCIVLRQDPRFQGPNGWLREFAGPMNQLLAAATQPWFFKVDSDEVPSEALTRELREVLPGASQDAFTVPMRYTLKGIEILSASTYPMRQLRVLRTGAGLTYGRSVHESIDSSDLQVGVLDHPILLPQWPARVLARRWWRYLRIEVDGHVDAPFSRRWRDGAVPHLRSVRWLLKGAIRAHRDGPKPAIPYRYEILRIANDLVAVAAIVAAPLLRRPAA